MEIELKWGLKNPEDLGRLLAHLPDVDAVLFQSNHYYSDSDGELSNRKTMVRFRQEGSVDDDSRQVILTVKRRVAKEAGVFRAEEVEEFIDSVSWKELLAEKKSLDELQSPAIRALRSSGLKGEWKFQGSLNNKRHVVTLDGFILEVDKTTYDDGHIDVEVEVETEDTAGAKRLLTEIGQECGIVFFEQTQGKYSRFLSRSLGLR